ncbi:T9SS type A sorting domain-containing protein [Chryseobacterium sp. TY4]
MRKTLLTIGALVSIGQMQAQDNFTYIGDKAYFKVSEGALVYSKDLSMRTVGSGVLDISGDVMIDGGVNNTFETVDTNGSAKSNGGNIILRMNNASNDTYGQLYIEGFSQNKITGIVDKEYRERKHGTYQQLSLPFYGKILSTLNTEFGKTFSDVRWSKNEILKWNNPKPRFDIFSVNQQTLTGLEYIALGSGNFDASSNPTVGIQNPNAASNPTVPSYTNGVYIVRGKPIADTEIKTARLYGAGLGINYGTSGQVKNIHGETYNSYLQDNFDASVTNPWSNANFGKNLYQYGNPYLTNLDLSQIGIVESATTGDGNAIPNIQGIRFDPGEVTSDSDGATYSTNAKYITYAGGVVPVADVNNAIIKPMQTFVVKLANSVDNASYNLNFKTLRRFKYTARAANVNYDVTANRGASATTVKQLGVIALDANGKELSRTYYVVYADAKTGMLDLNQVSSQVTAGPIDIIGTYEEKPDGGMDTNLSDKYWLYVNEANETNFAGKPVVMELYSNDIKSLKFEILEDAEMIDDNQSLLSSGKAFYIRKSDSSELVTISQGKILDITGDKFNLYYDKPNDATLGNYETKMSRCKIAYNPNIDEYVLLFDPKWNEADVKVYDISGKLIVSKNRVSTKKDLILDIQKLNGTYVVTATSEKGEVFNGKIIR